MESGVPSMEPKAQTMTANAEKESANIRIESIFLVVAQKLKEAEITELDSLLLNNAEKLEESTITGLRLIVTINADKSEESMIPGLRLIGTQPSAESRPLRELLGHPPPQVLNQIVSELPAEHTLAESRPIHELLGHTPPQVLNQIVSELSVEHSFAESRPLRELLGHTPPQINADKSEESTIPGLRLIGTADTNEAPVLERTSLIKNVLLKLKPFQGSAQAAAKQGYRAVKETVKGAVKTVLENPKEAKDIMEDIVELVSKKEASDLPSSSDLPSFSDLPSSSDMPFPVGFFKWINAEIVMLGLSLVGWFSLYLLTSSAISTYGLGDTAKFYRCISWKYKFAGIFVAESDFSTACRLLGGLGTTDENCKEMCRLIGLETDNNFIACLVCGGSVYLAYKGGFRVVKGSFRNNNLAPVLLGVFRNGNVRSTCIPIAQFDQFIILTLPDLRGVLNDRELVDIVAMARNRDGAAEEIVKEACRRNPALDEVHVAVLFFH